MNKGIQDERRMPNVVRVIDAGNDVAHSLGRQGNSIIGLYPGTFNHSVCLSFGSAIAFNSSWESMPKGEFVNETRQRRGLPLRSVSPGSEASLQN